MILVINQDMQATFNYAGVVPDDGGPSPAEPDLSIPSVASFAALEDGGLFNFKASKVPIRIQRINLDLADATTWSLRLRTKDAAGDPIDLVLHDETTASGNVLVLHNSNEIVFYHEDLVLVTAGATGAMRAQIAASGW